MRIGRYKTLFLLLPGMALAGCATPPFCDALNKCGGDFLQGAASTKWTATTADSCVDEVPNPPSPPSAALVPPRPAGVRAIEPTTLDWCAGLVVGGDGTVKFDDGWFETLQKYNGWFPSVPLATAELELVQKNNQYTFTTEQRASQRYELTAQCMVAQGVVLACSALADQITASVTKTLGNIEALKGDGPDGQPRARVYNQSGAAGATCAATTDGGCNCAYNVSLTTTTTGPWSAAAGEINFFDANWADVYRTAADVCYGDS